MFVDSLHSLNGNNTEPANCLLGASQPEVTISPPVKLSLEFNADVISTQPSSLPEKALLLSNSGNPCKYLGLS
jgi:hypothetical protein